MNPYNFSVLCFGFCSLLVGLFVWLKRQDQTGKLYFILSLFYAGWALPFSIKISDNVSYVTAIHAARIANCCAAFIPTVWYHFCLVYTERLKLHRKLLLSLYGVPLLIVCFFYSPWFVTGLRPILSFKYYATPGPLYYLMTINYFVVVPMGFYQLLKKRHEVVIPERGRILGLFWSAFAGYTGGAVTFLPIYGIAFPQEGMFLLPIYPFALAYFMVKQRLFDVEKIAQAAHRDKLVAIGVLAASINHEVRNPLYIIQGMADNFLSRQEEGSFSDKDQLLKIAKDGFTRSKQQIERAMDIIKRLSMFAKSGVEQELKMGVVNAADVIGNLLPLIRHEMDLSDIRLDLDIPANMPLISADRSCLEEIFFNLFVNAIQAIKATGQAGLIQIKANVVSKSIVLTITDSGPGIPQDKLDHIFQPFYTTKEQGTGLGLYITKQLVEKNRGRITAESDLGKGMKFILEFCSA